MVIIRADHRTPVYISHTLYTRIIHSGPNSTIEFVSDRKNFYANV